MMVRLFCSPVTQVKFHLRAASLASEVGSWPAMRLSSVVIRVTARSERFAGVAGSFYCSRRTRGQTDGRRCAGPALLFDGLAGVRGVALAARPSGVYSGPLPVHDRCQNVHANSKNGAQSVSEPPSTDARGGYGVVKMSGSDSYTPVSLSPLTIANQDGRTQNWASANCQQ